MITIRDIKIAERNGITKTALEWRMRRGWDKERATSEPMKGHWLDIARKNGINPETYNTRVYSYMWDKERAATEPIQKENHDPERKKWIEVGKENGISHQLFCKREGRGFSWEQCATRPLERKRKA